MRYGPEIVKEIVAELEKVPVIRQACIKFGIDHSTFYRWMTKHLAFHQAVVNALWLGRHRMNDAAESVIITGIQNQSMRASTFWLSHNSERYMSIEKGKHHRLLEQKDYHLLKMKKPPDGYPPTFEKLFEIYSDYESDYDQQLAKKLMEPIVELFCWEDPKIIEIFYATYEGWKENIRKVKDQAKKMGMPEED